MKARAMDIKTLTLCGTFFRLKKGAVYTNVDILTRIHRKKTI
jgi:hypothetical protein